MKNNTFSITGPRSYFAINLNDVSSFYCYNLVINFILKNGTEKYIQFGDKEDFDEAIKCLKNIY